MWGYGWKGNAKMNHLQQSWTKLPIICHTELCDTTGEHFKCLYKLYKCLNHYLRYGYIHGCIHVLYILSTTIMFKLVWVCSCVKDFKSFTDLHIRSQICIWLLQLYCCSTWLFCNKFFKLPTLWKSMIGLNVFASLMICVSKVRMQYANNFTAAKT